MTMPNHPERFRHVWQWRIIGLSIRSHLRTHPWYLEISFSRCLALPIHLYLTDGASDGTRMKLGWASSHFDNADETWCAHDGDRVFSIRRARVLSVSLIREINDECTFARRVVNNTCKIYASKLIFWKIWLRPDSRVRSEGEATVANTARLARTLGIFATRKPMQTDVLTDIFLAGQSVRLARRTTLRTPRQASANLGKWVNVYIVTLHCRSAASGEGRNVAFVKKCARTLAFRAQEPFTVSVSIKLYRRYRRKITLSRRVPTSYSAARSRGRLVQLIISSQFPRVVVVRRHRIRVKISRGRWITDRNSQTISVSRDCNQLTLRVIHKRPTINRYNLLRLIAISIDLLIARH